MEFKNSNTLSKDDLDVEQLLETEIINRLKMTYEERIIAHQNAFELFQILNLTKKEEKYAKPENSIRVITK